MSPGPSNSPLKSSESPRAFVDIPLNEIETATTQHNTNNDNNVKVEEMKNSNLGRNMRTILHNLDILAKRTRKKVHQFFYKLGRRIQDHYWKVLLLSCVILAIPCLFGLKDLKVENDIETLWVASEGRLQDEIQYTRKMIGSRGFGESTVESEVLIQVVKNEGENILTRENFLYHFEMLREIMGLTIDYYDQTWGFGDFCVKYEIPHLHLSRYEYQLAEKISPCIISTPIDCFWEGSKVIAPNQKSNGFSWQTESPRQLINHYISIGLMSPIIGEYIDKIGANDGYLKKPCLDPLDISCPKSFDRLAHSNNLDIGAILTGGCYGVATKYMHWPEGAIISEVTKNASGHIKTAKALQSIIYVTNADDFYNNIPYEKKSRTFTKDMAKNVLKEWKIAVTNTVKEKQKQRPLSKTKIMAFSTESFYNLVKNFSKVDLKKVLIAVGILICYSFLTLKRWTSSIFSYGLMGILGPILVCYSIASGIGISQFLGLDLSVISTQVLPFVALAIGLDNMFLLLRKYVTVCDTGQVIQKKIIAVCLGECGLRLTMAFFINIFGFLATTLIPIIALREFCFQISIILFVTWFTLLFTLTPLLCADVERQALKRTDCFCMKGDYDDEADDEEISANQQPPLNNTDIENCFHIAFPMEISSQQQQQQQPQQTQQPQQQQQQLQQQQQQQSSTTESSNCYKPFTLKRSTRQFNVAAQNADQNTSGLNQRFGCCGNLMKKFSINYFVRNYLTDVMTVPIVKALISLIGGALLITAGYGSTLVTEDLDLSEMIPDDVIQKTFFQVQKRHFSYYDFEIITKRFDYANQQRLLYEFNEKLLKVSHVVRHERKGESSRFWLKIFSNWLKDYESIFRKERSEGNISQKCIPRCKNASYEARIVYRILSTSTWNDQQNSVSKRLVYDDGIVNPKWFYLALNLWYNKDYLGAAKVIMKPNPIPPTFLETEPNFDGQSVIEPHFVTMSFSVNGLETTEDYIKFIKDIRSICEDFKTKGLESYPTGIPFTYWEQFIFLKKSLINAGMIVLFITWLLVGLTIMSVKAATFVLKTQFRQCFTFWHRVSTLDKSMFMFCTSFELYGFLGWFDIKLNAISVVVLIMSNGIALEYSLHTVLAFVNTKGDRNKRMKAAIEITFASSLDGILSTVIMAVLLSYSQYEFVNKYFFHLLFCLMCIIFLNALFVLPIMLSFCGPCCEVTNQAIRPTIPPAFVIKISPEITIQTVRLKKKKPKRIVHSPALTTISERSERCSTSASNFSDRCSTRGSNQSGNTRLTRPHTPALFGTTPDVISLEDFDSNVVEETSFNNTLPASQVRATENRNQSDRHAHSSTSSRSRDSFNSSYMDNDSRVNINSSNSHGYQDNSDCYRDNNCDYRDNSNGHGHGQNSRSAKRPATGYIHNTQGVKPKNTMHDRKKKRNRTSTEPCNSTRNNDTYPRVIEVRSRDDNRSTTKVKATISIEVEHSHPIGMSYNDNYDDFIPVDS